MSDTTKVRAHNFRHVKAGDKVVRMLAGTIRMEMFVTKVDDRLVYASVGPDITDPGMTWTFDRDTGAEVDEDIQLPPGVAVSMLVMEN